MNIKPKTIIGRFFLKLFPFILLSLLMASCSQEEDPKKKTGELGYQEDTPEITDSSTPIEKPGINEPAPDVVPIDFSILKDFLTKLREENKKLRQIIMYGFFQETKADPTEKFLKESCLRLGVDANSFGDPEVAYGEDVQKIQDIYLRMKQSLQDRYDNGEINQYQKARIQYVFDFVEASHAEACYKEKDTSAGIGSPGGYFLRSSMVGLYYIKDEQIVRDIFAHEWAHLQQYILQKIDFFFPDDDKFLSVDALARKLVVEAYADTHGIDMRVALGVLNGSTGMPLQDALYQSYLKRFTLSVNAQTGENIPSYEDDAMKPYLLPKTKYHYNVYEKARIKALAGVFMEYLKERSSGHINNYMGIIPKNHFKFLSSVSGSVPIADPKPASSYSGFGQMTSGDNLWKAILEEGFGDWLIDFQKGGQLTSEMDQKIIDRYEKDYLYKCVLPSDPLTPKEQEECSIYPDKIEERQRVLSMN